MPLIRNSCHSDTDQLWDLLERSLAAGVAFIAGDAFYSDPAGESELRLCFSSVMPATIDDAVRRLAGCLPSAAQQRQLRPIA